MKRGHDGERGSALDRREPKATKAKKRMQLWILNRRVAFSWFFFSF